MASEKTPDSMKLNPKEDDANTVGGEGELVRRGVESLLECMDSALTLTSEGTLIPVPMVSEIVSSYKNFEKLVCSDESTHADCKKSLLDSPVDEFMVNILFGVEDQDMEQNNCFCTAIQKALTAQECQCACCSSQEKTLPPTTIDSSEASVVNEIEPPNAPKQNRVRDKLSKENLEKITVRLFP